jgi:diguanylate cyclase (GGDEF)-like protein
MKKQIITKRLLILWVAFTMFWVPLSYTITTTQIKTLQDDKYLEAAKEAKREVKSLISAKQEALMLISLGMSHSEKLQQALIKGDQSSLGMKDFSTLLKEHTAMKHVWFQIIKLDGTSFYRSWTDNIGDDLSKIRSEVADLLDKPRVINTMSVGIFDITFKSMVPIFYQGKLIGIFESIGKFNSISNRMHDKGFDTVIVVDKSYKKQIKFPFSDTFIDDYYIANIDAKPFLLEHIKSVGIEMLVQQKLFYLDTKINKVMTSYNIRTPDKEHMGNILIFQNKDHINMHFIIQTQQKLVLFFVLSYLIIIAAAYYIYFSRFQRFVLQKNRELREKVDQKIQELKHKNETYHHMAHHDALTGLPNRLLCLDRIEQSIKHARREGKGFTLLFLDLDRFKEINDTFGHDMGDRLLKRVAKKLRLSVREYDTIARLGGDEFVILIEDVPHPNVLEIIQKIIGIMQRPIVIGEHKLHSTCSIGVSNYPEDGKSAEILLRNADTAMYRAKEIGKNTYQFYNIKMTELAFEKLTLDAELRKAIKNNEFEAFYQCKYDVVTETIIGVEALIRWRHEKLGFISPMEFIGLAEEVGLIQSIDRWMLQETTQKVLSWQKEGFDTGTLAINISIKHLESSDFVPYVEAFIENSKFDPSLLEFEITESQIMKEPELAIEKLRRLKELGISISIDDFGTGYSSLSYLKRLPINKLKIDKSFVDDLPEDLEDVAIVQSIIALAKSLRLEIVAEGVETKAQRDFLVEAGCHVVQGYYYSKPLSAKDYEALLEDGF